MTETFNPLTDFVILREMTSKEKDSAVLKIITPGPINLDKDVRRIVMYVGPDVSTVAPGDVVLLSTSSLLRIDLSKVEGVPTDEAGNNCMTGFACRVNQIVAVVKGD